MRGDTQEETAQKVGRSARTIRNWEDEPWWPDAVSEARDTWLSDVVREARAALYLQLKKARDPVRAMAVLERMDPDFAPPKQEVEHSGGTHDTVTHEIPRANRIAAIRALAGRASSPGANGTPDAG